MTIRIQDTMSGKLVDLPARRAGETSLYVCGPTVYGLIHVGNARPAIVFDVLVRHLRAQGRNVNYVRNFTDVDDKIIDVAVSGKEDPREVAKRFTDAYLEDVGALGCKLPNEMPRVSAFMPQIIELVEKLIAKGVAYERDGDVYFSCKKFPEYGKLSHRKLDQMRAGERVAVSDIKDDPLDFALWKSSKTHEPEGARWRSPWGEGRPGWHIECSAMSLGLLGSGFDVHGGGIDLVFPHHENEIAQSEAATGERMCGAWMHNGFIEFGLSLASFPDDVAERITKLQEADPALFKISKSDTKRLDDLRAKSSLDPEEKALEMVLSRKVKSGHWFQLRRLLGRVEPEAVRYWMLSTHYRSPLGFDVQSDDSDPSDPHAARFPGIEAAAQRVAYVYDTKAKLLAKAKEPPPRKLPQGTPAFNMKQGFDDAMNTDLNTAKALASLQDVLGEANRVTEKCKRGNPEALALLGALDHMLGVLGVGEGDPAEYFEARKQRICTHRGVDVQAIDERIEARRRARAEKDFATSDAIRDELLKEGIELRDDPAGTTWNFRIG